MSPNTPLPMRLVGKPGLCLGEVQGLLQHNLRKDGSGYVIFQIGGNDIGCLPEYEWLSKVKNIVAFTAEHFPNYRMVWSDMLPRLKWRHCTLSAAKKLVARLQRRARQHFYQFGYVIRHPCITTDLLDYDGVHLTTVGNAFLLAELEEGSKHFV